MGAIAIAFRVSPFRFASVTVNRSGDGCFFADSNWATRSMECAASPRLKSHQPTTMSTRTTTIA